MEHELRKDPDRADEVLRSLVGRTISPEDAVNELWCMADQHYGWREDSGEALSRFKTFGLELEARDSEGPFAVEAWRSELLMFAREVLAAGGRNAYDRRFDQTSA